MTPPDDDLSRDRVVEAEIEVPGTPEQVWEAIATGPGITAWFVPTEVDEREGGVITQRHGPEMDTSGEITAWEPPHRFAYLSDPWQPTEDAPPERVAAEFLIEAQAGGTCIVRVVNSGFGTGAGWDQAIESTRHGWPPALYNLRLYLTHFPGLAPASFAAGGIASGTREEAWDALLESIGLPGAAEGERLASGAGSPPLAGTVERLSDGQMLMRTDEPGPGLAYVGAGGPGYEVYTFVRGIFYGDEAPAIATEAGAQWQAWMDERFPAAQAGRAEADA
jgi:uncharacterized protein YndB with AHSA1/START domain